MADVMAPDMSTHEMLDDVDLTVEEPFTKDAYAIAGYVNGNPANWPAIVAKYGSSGKFLLSIDVQANPAAGAQCLDIESGDARISQAPGWVKATQANGKAQKDLRWYPKVYTSAGNVKDLIAALEASGIKRDEYMVWSAHFTDEAHICAPDTCGFPQADATQWTSTFEGASLDASLCYGYFFSGPGGVVPKPPKPPVVTVSWAAWPSSVTLSVGSKGEAVKVLQSALRDSGLEGARGITVDGDFEGQTLTAVKNFQSLKGLTVDGVAGPKTRAALEGLGDVPEPSKPAVVEAPKASEPVAPVSVPEPVSKAPEVEVTPEAVEAPKVAENGSPAVTEPTVAAAPPVTVEPDVLVYLPQVASAEFAKDTGIPEGTVMLSPYKAQRSALHA